MASPKPTRPGAGTPVRTVATCGVPAEYEVDLSGFVAPSAALPAERDDIARERRDQAALLVLGIGRGYVPEDLVGTAPGDVLEAFTDDLERDEAFAHVDLLLEALAPLAGAAR